MDESKVSVTPASTGNLWPNNPIATNSDPDKSPIPKYPLLPSYRFLVICLLLGGSFLIGLNQFPLGFLLPCLINGTTSDNSTEAASGFDGSLRWSTQDQSHILAAEEWGAIAFVFGVGWLLDRFGAKWPYFVGLGACGVISLLMPLAATAGGWKAFFALRLFQGTMMEVAWPAVFYVAPRWFPASEAGFSSGMATCGFQLAAIFSTLVSGFVCASPIHWQGMYYVVGVASLVGCVIWLFSYQDDVATAKCISPSETTYILSQRPLSREDRVTLSNTPFLKIFSSTAVWAVIITNFCSFYLFYFIGGFLPSYFKDILGYNSIFSGIYAAIPSIASIFALAFAGALSDRLIASKRVTITVAIKVFTALSGVVPAALCAALPHVHSQAAVVVCLTLASIFNGFTVGGHMKAMYVIAPSYSGTISGCCATTMYASGIVCSYVTGAIIQDGKSAYRWSVAFYVNAAVIVVGVIQFLVIGTGMRQSWDKRNE